MQCHCKPTDGLAGMPFLLARVMRLLLFAILGALHRAFCAIENHLALLVLYYVFAAYKAPKLFKCRRLSPTSQKVRRVFRSARAIVNERFQSLDKVELTTPLHRNKCNLWLGCKSCLHPVSAIVMRRFCKSQWFNTQKGVEIHQRLDRCPERSPITPFLAIASQRSAFRLASHFEFFQSE